MAPTDVQNNREHQEDRTAKRPKKVMLAGLLAALIAIISIWPLRSHGGHRPEPHTVSTAEITLLPLTGLDGEQRQPAFSPDGSRVVFVRSARVPNESGLYAAVVGSQSLLRLTQSMTATHQHGLQTDAKSLSFAIEVTNF